MAARPHGADEPREGPIGEPLDEGGSERAPGRSAHREDPDGTGPSGPTSDDESASGSRDVGSASSDEGAEGAEGAEEGAAVPADDGAADAEGTDASAIDRPGDVPAGGRAATSGRPRDEPEDVDARWQEIIAQLAELDSDASAPVRADPDPEGQRGADSGAGRAPIDPAGARTVRPSAPASAHRSWSPDPAVEEAEDHFEPPDPGPVLGGDPLLTMAWVVVVGVPLLFIAAVVVWRDIPTVVLRSAAVAFVAGVGLLLWRMPHRRDEDDGPGAVV